MAKTPEEFEALQRRILSEQDERPTEPPTPPPPSGGIDPAKARWDELLRLLRSIDDNIRKVLDAEHQGLETVGVEPRTYVEADTRTLAEVIIDAERASYKENS